MVWVRIQGHNAALPALLHEYIRLWFMPQIRGINTYNRRVHMRLDNAAPSRYVWGAGCDGLAHCITGGRFHQ